MTLRAGTARVFARKVHVCHGICTQSEILVTAGQDCLHICPASFLSKRMKTYCRRAAQDCLHICLAKLVSKTQANLLQKSGARLSAQMFCTACCWKKEKSDCKRVAQDCLHICLAQLVAKTRKAEHIFSWLFSSSCWFLWRAKFEEQQRWFAWASKQLSKSWVGSAGNEWR